MKRRTFLKTAAASALASPILARPSLAQDWRATTLRFVPQANLTSLDPIWTTATVTLNHGYYVFDTLFALDLGFVPRPQMAEGAEKLEDGKRWRIKLREGLKFHDNTPVRSADCIASIARWGKRDSFGQLLAAVTESMTAIDDRTFEIKLTRAFPLLLEALGKADVPAFMMPERLAQTDANKQVPEMVGSGPYRFVQAEFNPGSRVAYEKFDGYVPRAEPPSRGAGGKIANFKRIEWHVIADASTAANALVKGEVDWWERPPTDIAPVLAASKDIAREILDPTGRVAIMRLNHLHPPFNNLKTRQAVRMAVMQSEYMQATQGDDPANWTTCLNLWPKGTEYYDGDLTDLMPQNLDKAKAALKDSGYAGEKVVIINPTDFPDIGPLGLVSADILKKIGMNVELIETDWGTVVQRRSSREPVEKGGWSIFHTTGGAGAWANPALSFIVRGQGTGGWFGWWGNQEAEKLATDWLYATDPAAQKAAAVKLGRLALDEVATVPLGQFTLKTAYRRSLTGILPGSAPYPWGVRRA